MHCSGNNNTSILYRLNVVKFVARWSWKIRWAIPIWEIKEQWRFVSYETRFETVGQWRRHGREWVGRGPLLIRFRPLSIDICAKPLQSFYIIWALYGVGLPCLCMCISWLYSCTALQQIKFYFRPYHFFGLHGDAVGVRSGGVEEVMSKWWCRGGDVEGHDVTYPRI